MAGCETTDHILPKCQSSKSKDFVTPLRLVLRGEGAVDEEPFALQAAA